MDIASAQKPYLISASAVKHLLRILLPECLFYYSSLSIGEVASLLLTSVALSCSFRTCPPANPLLSYAQEKQPTPDAARYR